MVRARIQTALLWATLLAAGPACKSPFRCFDVAQPADSMPTTASLKIGETFQIDGAVWADCERAISTKLNWSAFTFTSENTGIASVSKEGLITGVGVGQTTVHIRRENTYSGPSWPVRVTVTPP